MAVVVEAEAALFSVVVDTSLVVVGGVKTPFDPGAHGTELALSVRFSALAVELCRAVVRCCVGSCVTVDSWARISTLNAKHAKIANSALQ